MTENRTDSPQAVGQAPVGRGWSVFLWVAGSAHFALVYTLNTQPFLSLTNFAAGQERAPYQYRALTAWLLWTVERVGRFPAGLEARLPPRMNQPVNFAVLGIAFFSMMVAVYATRRALERLARDGDADAADESRWWALLVLAMAYFQYLLAFGHPCCAPLQLPYDLPSLAFFALGLWAMVERRVGWLYVLVPVAMCNRESTVFLVAMYLLYELGERRRERVSVRTAFFHAGALGAMCLAVLAVLHRAYPGAVMTDAVTTVPGLGTFANHALENFHYLLLPYYWPSYLGMFGFSWIFVYARWTRVPRAGVRWALATGPMMLAAMWVVGVLSEIRIFGELTALMTVALTLLLRREFGWGKGNG